MKKIFITGSGGFIFSNFIRRSIYLKKEYEIVSIDKIKKGSTIKNIYANKNHKFYIGDICDRHLLNVIMEVEKPELVIHAAADSSVDASIKDPSSFIKNNVDGTQAIIDASLKWGVKEFIQVSTDEIYGHLETENAPGWTEDAPMDPRNPYAASKAAAELLVKAAGQTFGLPYKITRSANNYGPRQTTDKLIPRIIECILQDKPIPIYGEGKQVRDWLHVFDNCSAIMTVIDKGEMGEAYNIGAGQEFCNLEIVKIICDVLGHGHQLISFVEDRPGHDFRYSLDCTKIKELGWEKEFKFKEGVKQCVQWFINNQWWFGKG